MALHLGEMAQDERREKQRGGRMMALHCRSRAVLSALLWASECRRPHLVMPNWVTYVAQRIGRMNRQKVVLHRARAALVKIPSSILRAASTFSSFGIPKPTVRGPCVSGSRTFVGNWQRASFGKRTEL